MRFQAHGDLTIKILHKTRTTLTKCLNLSYISLCLAHKSACFYKQLIVHERYRFFHYLNTNFTNVVSVGSAVNST